MPVTELPNSTPLFRVDRELLGVFLLTPVWWILGFNIFIYHAIALFVFVKLLLYAGRAGESLRIPNILLEFTLFLLFYLASILLNAGIRPAERVFASINNYLLLVMGFLTMLAVYHAHAESFFRNL